MRVLRALAPAALLLSFSSAPALALHAAAPSFPSLGRNVTTGALPSGGMYIIRSSDAIPVAVVELWYRAPSTGFGATPVPSLARVAAETVVASQPLTGKSLGTLVSDLGGTLSVSAYADSLEISAIVPSPGAAQVVRAMTTDFFAPVVTEDGLHEAQHTVAEEALLDSFNADDVARDAIFGALFTGGPAHYPVVSTPQEVVGLAFTDVRAFAQRAFRSQNAVLVVNGDVDSSISDAAVTGRAAGSDVDSAPSPEPAVASTVASSPQSVLHPLDQSGGAYGWIGPPISDEREATALDFIADYLFRPDVGTVARRVAKTQPDADISGQFITLHDPGVFFVSYTANNPAAVKASIDAGLASMRTPLDPAQFAVALDAFTYHLLSDLQTPLSIADNFGWYTVEGNSAYAPGAGGEEGAYFRAMQSLTPQFVADVARKYLGTPGVTVVLSPQKDAAPTKGSSS
ncbi:MAG TPA: insulinase family protein [Candidatus Acidoferrales bacterium]|nr:insulinase family protein [Candidatus Acidoferrales bacterium]